MLPWPKPAVWPSVPPEASSEVLLKEKVYLPMHSDLLIYQFGMVRKEIIPVTPLIWHMTKRHLISLLHGGVNWQPSKWIIELAQN